MKHWFMLTVVGKDQPGIVAHITSALYEGGCNLGEASMLRLGGNFTIMLMVQHDGSLKSMREMLETVVDSMGLHMHVDRIEGELHHHVVPDVRITVSGADRAGIVAKVTTALAEAGLNILNLESDVAGSEQAPLYIMQIEGVASEGIEGLRSVLALIAEEGVDAKLDPIDTMVG